MMRIAICFCFLLAATALHAQQSPPDAPRTEAGEFGHGLDLLSEGMRLLMQGLQNEMTPALEGLRDMLKDLDAYQAPEILPNGDIIIRRKTPLDTPSAPDDDLQI